MHLNNNLANILEGFTATVSTKGSGRRTLGRRRRYGGRRGGRKRRREKRRGKTGELGRKRWGDGGRRKNEGEG